MKDFIWEFWKDSCEVRIYRYASTELLPILDENTVDIEGAADTLFQLVVTNSGALHTLRLVDGEANTDLESAIRTAKLPPLPKGFQTARFAFKYSKAGFCPEIVSSLRSDESKLFRMPVIFLCGEIVHSDFAGSAQNLTIGVTIDKPWSVHIQQLGESCLPSRIRDILLAGLAEPTLGGRIKPPIQLLWDEMPESVRFVINVQNEQPFISRDVEFFSGLPLTEREIYFPVATRRRRQAKESEKRQYFAELQAKPDSAQKWFDIGMFYRGEQNYDAALEHFQRALSLKEDWPELHREYAYTLEKNSRSAAQKREIAEPVIEHYLAAGVGDKNAEVLEHYLESLAIAYAALGRYKDVARIHRRIGAHTAPLHRLRIAKLLMEAGDFSNAFAELRKELRHIDKNHEPHFLAQVYYELSNVAKELGQENSDYWAKYEFYNQLAKKSLALKDWYKDPATVENEL